MVRGSTKLFAVAAVVLSFIGVRTLFLFRTFHASDRKIGGLVLKPPRNAREEAIEREMDVALRNVKRIRDDLTKKGLFFEADEQAKAAAAQLQNVTRYLLESRYGQTTRKFPYRVRLDFYFEATMPDFHDKGDRSTILLELAPVDYLPHSVFNFLEMIRNGCGEGENDRITDVFQHIVVFRCGKWSEKLYFQEYVDEYPHRQRTLGWSNRPGGPNFYVSILDNSEAHGRGSQGQPNPYEADSPIGKVIEGFEEVVLGRLTYVVNNKMAYIEKTTILHPDLRTEQPVYRKWSE